MKTSTFGLYPANFEQRPVIGEAPLQTGAYAFFFEPVEIETLKMGSNGIVTSTNNKPVSPYIVVNIKKGITLGEHLTFAISRNAEVLNVEKSRTKFDIIDKKTK